MNNLRFSTGTLALVSVLLFLGILYYIHWLSSHFYFQWTKEGFKSGETYTVNMPINTTQDCLNFCNPSTARCAKTGQQCQADLDCPGCQPEIDKAALNPPIYVPGANDAGKLTTGSSLNYSPLTFGYGTKNEGIVSKDLYPEQADFGVNTWQQQFAQENDYYKTRYTPDGTPLYPKYPTTTGLFETEGPLPSNF